ncbi:DUF1772 domain-containing protein [Actinomadura rugatobispora]|uniref:DUF1772 domain-containing protein n=1 Tax=Actinomadura rugatobispora TaxID=1994 RepID=A0ABW1AFW1_9ACTN|nr:DUF1772 domain-containing protein [Actinomadura rugatobispora]
MRLLQTGTLLTAVIFAGLMAGLFVGFVCGVMPGLARASDRTLVDAMQGINKGILNPVFMLMFVGSIPVIGLAALLAFRGHGREAAPWLVAALVLYVVAFIVTMAANVPLNDQLDRAGDPERIHDIAAVRDQYESKWVAWNIVRALLHTASFACLAWALVLYGAHRLAEDPGTASSAKPSAYTATDTGHLNAVPHHIDRPRPPAHT